MTKQGNPWAIATVEDLEGAIEVMFFPQTYQTVSHVLAEDRSSSSAAGCNRRDDVPTIYAQELTLPDLAEGRRGPVVVSLPVARCTPPVVERLKEVLATHPGATEVHLRLTQTGRDDGDAARRRAAGHAVARAVRRPQGAARAELPGVTASAARRSPRMAPPGSPGPTRGEPA